MEFLSIIGLIVAIVMLIVLAMRGWSILLVAPMLSILIILTSRMDLVGTMTGAFMGGFGGFATRFFLIFLFGSLFGKLMGDSGAAATIAHGILRVIGERSKIKVLFTLAAITGILTYGGISVFIAVFAIMPIARPLCRETDVPWPLFAGALGFGMATFSMSMLPGTPQINNVIPTSYLGTTLTAAPAIGIVASVVTIAVALWWLNREIKVYDKKGLGYEETKGTLANQVIEDKYDPQTNPPLLLSLVPSIVLLVSLNVFKLNIILGLLLGVIASVVFLYKYNNNLISSMNEGVLNSAMPLVNTCSVVGFGTVVGSTVGFKMLVESLLTIPGPPLISFVVGTNIIAAITGSASGGLGIAMETLVPRYIDLLNPEVMHRLGSIASSGLDAMPHNGAVVTTLVVLGLTHKAAYKPIFFTCVVAPIVALVVAVIMALIMY